MTSASVENWWRKVAIAGGLSLSVVADAAIEGRGVNQFLQAKRTHAKIHVDGKLDEADWAQAPGVRRLPGALPDRGRPPERAHHGAGALRRREPLRRDPRLRPEPRADQQAARPARRRRVRGRGPGADRPDPQPQDRVPVLPERGRGAGRRADLRRPELHLGLGRRLGRRGRRRSGRVGRRVRDPAPPAPVRARRGADLGLRRPPRHPPEERGARLDRQPAHEQRRRLAARPPHRPGRAEAGADARAAPLRRRARGDAAAVLGPGDSAAAAVQPLGRRRRRPQVPAHLGPRDQRDGEPGLRPDRGGPDHLEPEHVRELLPREAAVLHPGARAVPAGRVQRRRLGAAAALLLAPDRPRRADPRSDEAHRQPPRRLGARRARRAGDGPGAARARPRRTPTGASRSTPSGRSTSG